MQKAFDFLVENWAIITPVLVAVLRLVPTGKSYDIINGIKNVLDIVIPNFKKNPDGSIGRHN